MLDSALDILFEALDELKKEQLYIARLSGLGEKDLSIFRRRFVKFEGNEAKVCVQSMTKAKQAEEALQVERSARRTERIFSLQSKIYEVQSAIDMIKSLEDAGPDDAIEYAVDTVVDDNGMPVRVDILDHIDPYAYNGEGEE